MRKGGYFIIDGVGCRFKQCSCLALRPFLYLLTTYYRMIIYQSPRSFFQSVHVVRYSYIRHAFSTHLVLNENSSSLVCNCLKVLEIASDKRIVNALDFQ
jgi:hypothetical protein